MRRPIIYSQEQPRSYDFLKAQRESLVGLATLARDLLGSSTAVVAGLAATPNGPANLSINIAAGSIYQLASVDAAQYGSLGQDTSQIMQQGVFSAAGLTFSTAALTSGHSQWALVQATFLQSDSIPSDDPNAGTLLYWNVDNPANPLVGPGGAGTPQNTCRDALCVVSIKYGAAATTGSEVPPNPDSGAVPLYLVDLAFGQTAITTGNILVAAPSVGIGVPSNYPQAPFLAGLVNSHHSGGAGQAPRVKLASEVQGTLPLANLPASSAAAGGGIATVYAYNGNPNTHIAGVQAVAGTSPPDFCINTSNGEIFVCTATGNAAAAVWTPITATGFTSGQLAMTLGTPVTEQTHGLGGVPAAGNYGAELVCITTDQGFAVGDKQPVPNGQDTTTNRGVGVYANATKLGAVIGSGGIAINPKGGGAANTITLANWKLVLWAKA